MKSVSEYKRILIISGGVGGAKLARGFYLAYPEKELSVIVNTADDDVFYGLYVSPDVDTVIYHLSGLVNMEQGWGLAADTYTTLKQLAALGDEAWFKLGDRDLATHLFRTKKLNERMRLTEITSIISRALGISARILPMTDDRVFTTIRSGSNELPFQEYFVKERWRVKVDEVRFAGVEKARPTPEVLNAIKEANLIVFAPSNPVVSIGPILSLKGLRDAVENSSVVKVAVSPIIKGKALKGPAAQLMPVWNLEPSAAGVADFYRDLVDCLFIDHTDKKMTGAVRERGMEPTVADIIMENSEDAARLARIIFDHCRAHYGLDL
jgi:LPPG:FO 2-phospho-L-lactate transferase